MKDNFINKIFSLIYKMKTTSLKKLLNHNFFTYGMVFISVLQLLNFYNANSLLCLGTFGLTYYVVCMSTKNKGLCLLAANVVSIFLLGCEKSGVLEGFKDADGNAVAYSDTMTVKQLCEAGGFEKRQEQASATGGAAGDDDSGDGDTAAGAGDATAAAVPTVAQ